jgi:hypothetical protein
MKQGRIAQCIRPMYYGPRTQTQETEMWEDEENDGNDSSETEQPIRGLP